MDSGFSVARSLAIDYLSTRSRSPSPQLDFLLSAVPVVSIFPRGPLDIQYSMALFSLPGS